MLRLLMRSARPLLDALETWLDHGLLTDSDEFFVCSGVCAGNSAEHLSSLWFCQDICLALLHNRGMRKYLHWVVTYKTLQSQAVGHFLHIL